MSQTCCGISRDGHYLLAGSSGSQGQGAELTVSETHYLPVYNSSILVMRCTLSPLSFLPLSSSRHNHLYLPCRSGTEGKKGSHYESTKVTRRAFKAVCFAVSTTTQKNTCELVYTCTPENVNVSTSCAGLLL